MAQFTVIAAAASLGMSLGSSVGGFVSAGKRRREARDAAAKADKAFKQAEQIATENKFAGLSIPKEAFEQQRETVLSNIAQTVQGAQEGSQRGAAAAGSRAGATGIMLGDKLRAGKEQALFNADLMERRGARAVQRDLAGLKLGVAQGAQMERADLMNAAATLESGATTNLANTAKQFLSMQNPFDKSEGDPTATVTQSQVDPNVTFSESALQGQLLRPTQPNYMTPDLNPIIQPQIIQQPEIFQPFNPFGMAGIQGNIAVA